jgi:hypothetical protein
MLFTGINSTGTSSTIWKMELFVINQTGTVKGNIQNFIYFAYLLSQQLFKKKFLSLQAASTLLTSSTVDSLP